MRFTKSLLLSAMCAFTFSSAALASVNPAETTSRVEIKNIIQDSEVFDGFENETTVHINFMVNSKNEIIVLSTNDKDLDNRLKSVLNYQKLKSTDIVANKKYTLPVVLRK